jgi:hypothetical protein
MPVNATACTVTINRQPLSQAQLRVLQSVDVEMGVGQQGMFKLKLAIGQDASGDWARDAEQTFTPSVPVSVDAQIGTTSTRLLNGVLTEFKMNFQADPCQSQLELTGMDVLEKLKRATSRQSFANQSLRTVVSSVFQRQNIEAPATGVPDTGTPNQNRETQMQAHNDLEFLRALADTANCEVYVEPRGDRDQGHFEPLDLANAPTIATPIEVNQGAQSPARSVSFYYDLSGPTVIEANLVDAQGRAGDAPVRSDLRDRVSPRDKTLLGPSDFATVQRLQRHGRETRDQLQRLCDTQLERHSWIVIGKGELDTAAYGDLLLPRRAVTVRGVSGAFAGTYLVWKVTHAFTRDLYCQRFELRRKLGVH